jgi:hypothetical protein
MKNQDVVSNIFRNRASASAAIAKKNDDVAKMVVELMKKKLKQMDAAGADINARELGEVSQACEKIGDLCIKTIESSGRNLTRLKPSEDDAPVATAEDIMNEIQKGKS